MTKVSRIVAGRWTMFVWSTHKVKRFMVVTTPLNECRAIDQYTAQQLCQATPVKAVEHQRRTAMFSTAA